MSPFEFAAWLSIAFMVGCLATYWRQHREDERRARREVALTIPVPTVASGDGSPLSAEDVQAVRILVAHVIAGAANVAYGQVVERICAQVARDEAEATDLDALLRGEAS